MKKINIFALINSILLSLFVIIGVCYDKYATITKIFSKPQLLILFPILIIVFYYFLKFIYSFFHNYKPREKANYPKIITFIFYRHPFLSMSIFTILISSLYLVFFYPGTMSFDGNWQLNSYFHYWTWNDHHPALLSIIMANILKFGNSILDANFGIFLFILIELIINGLVYGYVLNIMNKLNSPLILRIITFIFLSLFPLWSINSITYIKDTIYYLVFLFIFTFTYYHFYILKEYKLKNFLILGILYLILYIFRNTGFYIGILSTLSLAFLNFKNKKIFISFFCIFFLILSFHFFYQKVFLKIVAAEPALVREKLSIPLQQTARYIKYYKEDISAKEREGLEQLFITDLKEVGSSYDPNRSDNVKEKIKDYPTSRELSSYFSSWISMFLKHPVVYFDATLNNIYGYFYSEHKNFMGEELGFYGITNFNENFDFHFMESTAPVRTKLESISRFLCDMPLIGLLYGCFIYVWIIITVLFYLLKEHDFKTIIYFLPIYLTFLTCLISPVNGHMRYLAPVAVSTPLIIAIIFNKIMLK